MTVFRFHELEEERVVTEEDRSEARGFAKVSFILFLLSGGLPSFSFLIEMFGGLVLGRSLWVALFFAEAWEHTGAIHPVLIFIQALFCFCFFTPVSLIFSIAGILFAYFSQKLSYKAAPGLSSFALSMNILTVILSPIFVIIGFILWIVIVMVYGVNSV